MKVTSAPDREDKHLPLIIFVQLADLESLRKATDEDVIKSWRKLVLIHHPDKILLSTSMQNDNSDLADIRLINEAKSILLDPIKKQEWLNTFTDKESLSKGEQPKKDGPHIFRNISLDEFTPHYESSEDEDEVEIDKQPDWFTYPCRCSGEFKITIKQLEENVDIIGCEGCGEWIRVGYEVVEEEEEEEG
ncbi:uncharacterized protein L201_005145 [Kwoniella dendrophila CBS 6074]|uniref:Diphthamide biosynthesis protein 4 n=1 Tax=Kwoniella dendrophila CBS 6074 TaxID=1295534 RepID=A0AAX4JXY7_9TREE